MATSTNDGPASTCQSSAGKAVWYTFNPAASGAFQISACGSPQDTVLTVFSAVDCVTFVNANFVQVACDDDTCASGVPGPSGNTGGNSLASVIATVTLNAGTNYYIRFATFGAAPAGNLYQVAVYDLSATGACCTATGACSVVASASCASTGSGTAVFLGAGTTCTPTNPCQGACCNNTTGACALSQPGTATCATGNTFVGYGTSCSTTPCALGACCSSTGTCTQTRQLACSASATSAFAGIGATCTPTNPCTALLGACCSSTGTCTSTLVNGCTGTSSHQGVGTTCTPTNPCTALLGACCSSTGTCSSTLPSGCVSPSGFLGAGTTCSPTNPCTALVGACCSTTGTCSTAIASGCTGTSTFQGAGSTCTPNPCGGACCVGPVCSTTTSTGCTGTFQGLGSVCTPNPCGGSCCTPTAACSLAVNAGACVGTFTASGSCSPNPCAPGNDNCSFPMAAPFNYTADFTVSGSAANATNDGSYAGIAGNTISGCLPTNSATTTGSAREVYFSFTPATNGSLNADLCSTLPSFDSVLSIHSACGATVANTLACNDDGACSAGVGLSQILGLPVTGGTTYIIRVARFGTGTTTAYDYLLNVTTAAVGACCKTDGSCIVATNTVCINTTNNGTYMGNATTCGAVSCSGACCNNAAATCAITAPNACLAGSTFLGIGSLCSPLPCSGQACCDAATGACTLVGLAGTCPAGTTSSGPNTVCTPSPCTTSTCCNNATGACTVTGTAACPTGTTANAATACTTNPCTIQVCCNAATGSCSTIGTDPCPSGTALGTGSSCSPNPCPQPPPPSNDLCANPIALSLGVPYQGNNTFATGDATEGPVPSCQSSFSHSVWFSFTAPATTNYHFGSCGTLFDNVITVFSGPDCNTLTQIGCDDDTCVGGENAPGPGPGSALAADIATTALVAGQTYTVRLSGFSTNSGAYGLIAEYVPGSVIGSCCVIATCTLTDAANCTGTFNAAGGCIPNVCLPPSVCCRGATCSTAVTDAATCTASLVPGQAAGAAFVAAAGCNANATTNTPCCYADYDKSGTIAVTDIFGFLADWFAGSPYANTGGNGAGGQLGVQNIFDFLTDWFAGGCM